MRRYKICCLLFLIGLPALSMAQNADQRVAYQHIVDYLAKDTSLYKGLITEIKEKGFLIAPYFIKTAFENTCDFFKLSITARDTACNWQQKMDAEANRGYERKNDPVLVNLAHPKRAQFMIYFAKQYKNFIYCEVIPLTPKEATGVLPRSYPDYMGTAEVYVFTLNDLGIAAVRKGTYHIQ